MTFPRLVGSAHWRARVDEADVRVIRKQHREGVSVTTLCKRYGMTRQGMHRLIKGLTWAHVKDEAEQ